MLVTELFWMPISSLMNQRFPTIAVFTTAASFAGFALWLGMNPGALLTAFGRLLDGVEQASTRCS